MATLNFTGRKKTLRRREKMRLYFNESARRGEKKRSNGKEKPEIRKILREGSVSSS